MKNLIVKLSVFIVPLLIFFIVDINYYEIVNMKDVLLGAIALASSSLGFFIAGVSIMQTSKFSKFYKVLIDLGTDKKIIAWLMAAIGYLFFLAFLSLFLIFFIGYNHIAIEILYNIWFATLSAAFLSSLFVTLIIIFVFSKQ